MLTKQANWGPESQASMNSTYQAPSTTGNTFIVDQLLSSLVSYGFLLVMFSG